MSPYKYVSVFKISADPILFILINILCVFTLFNLLKIIFKKSYLFNKELHFKILLLLVSIFNLALFMQKQSIIRYNILSILLIIFISSSINSFIINQESKSNLKLDKLKRKSSLAYSLLIFFISVPFHIVINLERILENCLVNNEDNKKDRLLILYQ